MRTVRTRASEFAIVVAIVAIRAENLCPHCSPLTYAVQF
jgi:hypothetical protein